MACCYIKCVVSQGDRDPNFNISLPLSHAHTLPLSATDCHLLLGRGTNSGVVSVDQENKYYVTSATGGV